MLDLVHEDGVVECETQSDAVNDVLGGGSLLIGMRPDVISDLLSFLIIFPGLILLLLSLLADEAICHIAVDVSFEFEEEDGADMRINKRNTKLLNNVNLSHTFLKEVFLETS